jgi:hypothetical protein
MNESDFSRPNYNTKSIIGILENPTVIDNNSDRDNKKLIKTSSEVKKNN